MKAPSAWFVEILRVEGIDPSDYPDFVDAFCTRAAWAYSGELLSEEELDSFNAHAAEQISAWAREEAQCG